MRWQLLPFLAALAPILEAQAAGGLASDVAGSVAPVEAKIAFAIARGRTTRWVSLRVRGEASLAAWILPVKAGAQVDFASDAWLEALEDATAPRVLPPPDALPCGVMPQGPEVHGDTSHHVNRRPADIALLADAAEARAYADALGVTIPASMTSRLASLSAEGYRFVVASYVSLADGDRLAGLRIVDDAPPALPLLLTRAGSEAVKLTAFVIGEGRAAFGTGASLDLDPASLVWKANGRSTYAEARDSLLEAAPRGSFFIESAGHDLVFAAMAVPKSLRPIPSLVGAYLSRAAAYGEATDAAACVGSISALANRLERVALACAEGALVSDEECVESPRFGEIAPRALRCGEADELALAFSGLRPADVVLTRAIGFLKAHELGDDVPVSLADEPELSPLVIANGYEPCDEADRDDDDTWDLPGGGSSPPPWTPPPFPSEDEANEQHLEDSATFGCASSTEPEYDPWESDETCSSGTGGGGDYYDDSDQGCGSAGAGGYEDEDDGSCDGGSGGYEEESASEEECSLVSKKRRPRRLRLSAYVIALSAILLPIRRWTRKIREREP